MEIYPNGQQFGLITSDKKAESYIVTTKCDAGLVTHGLVSENNDLFDQDKIRFIPSEDIYFSQRIVPPQNEFVTIALFKEFHEEIEDSEYVFKAKGVAYLEKWRLRAQLLDEDTILIPNLVTSIPDEFYDRMERIGYEVFRDDEDGHKVVAFKNTTSSPTS